MIISTAGNDKGTESLRKKKKKKSRMIRADSEVIFGGLLLSEKKAGISLLGSSGFFN